MSATARQDVRACPKCRLTFGSRQSLRRHDALDHRPASDGAWLTARIVGTPHTCDESHRGGAGDDRAGVMAVLAERPAPTPARRPVPTPGPTRVPWLLVLALVGLAALAVPAGFVAVLALLVLARAFTPRRLRTRPYRSDVQHDESRTPEA